MTQVNGLAIYHLPTGKPPLHLIYLHLKYSNIFAIVYNATTNALLAIDPFLMSKFVMGQGFCEGD